MIETNTDSCLDPPSLLPPSPLHNPPYPHSLPPFRLQANPFYSGVVLPLTQGAREQDGLRDVVPLSIRRG